MRKVMIMLVLAIVSWGANAQMNHSMQGMSGMDSKMADKSATIMVSHSQSVTAIVNNYLALKNALVVDNSKKAASSGKMLADAIGKFDLSSQPASKQAKLKGILADAKENAEHISASGDQINHQRMHFEILGTDIKDLVVITGADRTLYQIYCPMFDHQKGGKWLSESKEIRNPLLGSKMTQCGSVVQKIALK